MRADVSLARYPRTLSFTIPKRLRVATIEEFLSVACATEWRGLRMGLETLNAPDVAMRRRSFA
jgi:hypothetical protein